MSSLRRFFYLVTRLGTLPVYRVIERFLFRDVVCIEHRGTALCSDDRGEAAQQILQRLMEALRLIEVADPVRFKRLNQDVNRILVTSIRIAAGAHFPRSRACYLSSTIVRDYPVPNVAIVLVHEATHARLDAVGVPYAPDIKPRIEQRCVREEIEFARRLSPLDYPGIVKWIAEREQRLFTMAGAARN